MTEESLDLRQLLGILSRNWITLLFFPLLGAVIAFTLAYQLPKRYKSTAILNIQASYFQNPLVNDLIAQVNDPSELQAQRMSLLRMAVNEDFLEQLGERYNIFQYPRGDVRRIGELEAFRGRIEYFSVSPTNFQVSATAGTPEKAQAIEAEVLERMKKTLIDDRYNNLTRTRDAIRAHVGYLADALKAASNPHSAEAIAEELDKIETSLRGLLTKFSESHPDVIELRKQEEALKAEARTAPQLQTGDNAAIPVEKISKEPNQEVFNDLLKKLNYLTVVIDMEKDQKNVSYIGVLEQPSLPLAPIFPDKKIFSGVGFGIGLVLAVMVVFLVEVRRGSYITPLEAAAMLEAPLLGDLPVLRAAPEKLLLPPATHTGSRRALPGVDPIKTISA